MKMIPARGERALSEAQFQRRITDLCDWLKLTWHHETDSRRSKPGFPDLVIVGNAVVFVELKTQSGRLGLEQALWINTLRQAGAEVHVWRPEHWPEIETRLRLLACVAPAAE